MVDEQRILIDPDLVLQDYLRAMGVERSLGLMSPYHRGKLEIGLKIETKRRILATAVGNSMLHLSQEEVVSVLTTVLVETGVYEDVVRWYEDLLNWKTVGVRFEPELTVSADGVERVALSPVFVPEEPDREPSPEPGMRQWHEGLKTADPDSE